jgi:8-oxo-dGTP diphosphatase
MQARQVFRSYDLEPDARAQPFAFCPRCGHTMGEAAEGGMLRPTCPACGFVQYSNPLPGVVALVERSGLVLLGKRTAVSFRGGLWCLPGGFMEWSEDFLSAGRREVREETGLEVRIRSILSVVTNLLSPRFHTLVIVLLASPIGGVERAGDDVEELSWIPLTGPLPEMAFEADTHIIERFAAGGLPGAPVDPRLAG